MEHNTDNLARNSSPRSWRITQELIFPSSLPWSLCLPILPLIGGLAILRGLFDPWKSQEKNFFVFLSNFQADSIFFPKPERILIHLGDILTYVSAASFHSLLCAFAIGYFVYLTCQLPHMLRWRALVFIMLASALLVVVLWPVYKEANEEILVLLGYKAICSMLSHASLGTLIVQEDCLSRERDMLTWLAWFPLFLGMSAALFAAAFAHADAGGLPHVRDREWRSAFTTRIKALQRSFYLLSLVLVSSTFTISLFSHMPSGLLNPKATDHPVLAEAVTTYANGLVVLWGGIFTLTLILTFAPSAYLLLRGARRHEEVQESPAEFRSWLHAEVFVSTQHQLGNVVTMLAPLMIGPIGQLLGTLTSG